MSETTKRVVWVRAGGRCVLCRNEVLDETIAPVPIADVAHVAGQGSGPATPRLVPEMMAAERDSADNLLLLCQPCHRKVDTRTLEQVYDLDTLHQWKVEHEKLVSRLLSLMDSSKTLVLRMIGNVRGRAVAAGRLEVGAATAARGRVPTYLPGRHHTEIEVDLTGVDEDDPAYWDIQRRRIERVVGETRDALHDGDADHLSVFAFARLPLLILLGWLLDDTTRVDIAQRSRTDRGWLPVDGPAHTFSTDVQPGAGQTSEALVVLSLSGTPDLTALPLAVQQLLRATVTPDGRDPGVDIADIDATRDAFDRELRRVLGVVEDRLVTPQALHVVVAAPLSMAVALGRAIDPQVFPAVHIYDLTDDGTYQHVMTLNSKERA